MIVELRRQKQQPGVYAHVWRDAADRKDGKPADEIVRHVPWVVKRGKHTGTIPDKTGTPGTHIWWDKADYRAGKPADVILPEDVTDEALWQMKLERDRG